MANNNKSFEPWCAWLLVSGRTCHCAKSFQNGCAGSWQGRHLQGMAICIAPVGGTLSALGLSEWDMAGSLYH